MKTIIELESWMLQNNINNIYTLNSERYITDIGEGLQDISGLFIWYSVDEKGNRTDIEFFKSEVDAVYYVFQYLKDKIT